MINLSESRNCKSTVNILLAIFIKYTFNIPIYSNIGRVYDNNTTLLTVVNNINIMLYVHSQYYIYIVIRMHRSTDSNRSRLRLDHNNVEDDHK